jgi:hypothetical protein
MNILHFIFCILYHLYLEVKYNVKSLKSRYYGESKGKV